MMGEIASTSFQVRDSAHEMPLFCKGSPHPSPLQAMTPLGTSMRQAVSFSWYAPPSVSTLAVK